jgi:hypothetical protein
MLVSTLDLYEEEYSTALKHAYNDRHIRSGAASVIDLPPSNCTRLFTDSTLGSEWTRCMSTLASASPWDSFIQVGEGAVRRNVRMCHKDGKDSARHIIPICLGDSSTLHKVTSDYLAWTRRDCLQAQCSRSITITAGSKRSHHTTNTAHVTDSP